MHQINICYINATLFFFYLDAWQIKAATKDARTNLDTFNPINTHYKPVSSTNYVHICEGRLAQNYAYTHMYSKTKIHTHKLADTRRKRQLHIKICKRLLTGKYTNTHTSVQAHTHKQAITH